MAMETKQLHNLSRIYREKIAEGKGKDLFKNNEIKGAKGPKKHGDVKLDITGGKKIQAEGVYDTVKNVMDKGSNFIKKNPVGKVLGKVVAPVKSTDGGSNRTSPTAASQKAKGLRTEENIDEMDRMGGPAAVGAVLTATAGLAKSGIDAVKNVRSKVQKATDKKNKQLKQYESYSNWRQDLKEIPDYEQIPASDKKKNEKISEKNVKNTIKINPDMKEEVVDENLIKFIKNPKATIQKAVDKKLTSATKKGSIGGIKVGGSASKLGSIGSGPLNTEGKRWQDDDGDGKWYEKSDVDGKISKREKKAKNHNCASKVKHEQFGVGDCISEAHDLDENGNVAHYDVEFEEYIVKGVPVEELEILEGHMHEHVIREKEESKIKNCGCGQDPCVTYGKQEDVKEGVYEKKKKEEVMSALKKRDLKDKVKKKIAADIVKKKGDTSKSDDRYAYESKLWDEFAEGYQRNPERDTRSAREKRMDDPDRGINSPAFRAFMAAQEGRSKKSSDKKKKG